jgi:hypothetical protein
VGTEISFGKSEIRLDTPVNKPPDGQITCVVASAAAVAWMKPTGHATLNSVAVVVEPDIEAYQHFKRINGTRMRLHEALRQSAAVDR